MRISTITKASYIAALSCAAVSVICVLLTSRAVEAERQATAERAELRQLSFDLSSASDLLTNEVRRYTVFGDKRHYDAYWREVKETRTRDRVVQRLTELGTPAAELALIEEAKGKSDNLIKLESDAMKAVSLGDLARARELVFGPDYDRDKVQIMAPIAKFRDMLVQRTQEAVDRARARADLMGLAAMISISVTAIIFLAILYGVLSRRVLVPLARMGDTLDRLSRDDHAVEVPDRDRIDEIGDMARAVQVLKESSIARHRLEADQAAAAEAKVQRGRAIEELVRTFEETVSRSLRAVDSASTELTETAETMAALAEQSHRQATASAKAAESTSANVQTVAAASEEMAASIQEISRQVTSSNEIAAKASHQARETTGSVREMAEAAHRIGEVVELIQTIASQTSLLALNATIEAARAGEAGKGFAVVATEVKALANQTDRATKEIGAQITAVQEATQGAVRAIEEIGGTITAVNEIAAAIAAAIEEQNATTGEITRSVQQAAQGTGQVSHTIGEVNQAATQTGDAAGRVLNASQQLSRQAGALHRDIETFLASIRAA
ncbi:HAMP domain-containing protein [Rhodoplanes serenus]|uniref:HAMP domain-containing protein n=1 Tax=Rhodoplanes serenus TaxID=200615 RepID=A0A9X4XTJ9_9BRAD|nr:HAMP domain-containing methyl-accepting chemotaxis protein [Rhodoplanes serenus]MTW18551.1 HAMP domain-containing protein [Rhodoplanes serenus]